MCHFLKAAHVFLSQDDIPQWTLSLSEMLCQPPPAILSKIVRLFLFLILCNVSPPPPGAGYDDSTAGKEKEDDAVPPGKYHKYVWDISAADGPTIDDPECLTYSYSSQVDPVRDLNSGLVGALLICQSSQCYERDDCNKIRECIFSCQYGIIII